MAHRFVRHIFLLLQLVVSVAPSGGVVLCVATDGHAAVELAVPGIGRCSDFYAAEGWSDVDHCKDIPLISLERQMPPGPPFDITPAQILVALPHAVPLPEASYYEPSLVEHGPPLELVALRALRSVILLI